ncbi:MAG: oligopeptidase B, partial [Thermoanaerobaculia bacterium]
MRFDSSTFSFSPLLFVLAAVLVAAACSKPASDPPQPPIAKKIPEELERHGRVRVDDYYWLKERENPEVIAYLEAENTYAEAVMKHTEPLQEKLFEEIVGRIKKDDASVPYKLDDYFYYQRFESGLEYPIYCRKRGSLDAEEEVALDVNQLAEGHEFFSMRGLRVSPNQDLVAYSTDSVGRRFYTLRFKNLATGKTLDDEISDITGLSTWAADNRTVFYVKQHPETLRWYRIYRHVLGTDPAADELIYEETDETYSTFVFKTKSRQYLMIASTQTLASEFRYLPADDPTGEFKMFQSRQRDHEYFVDHFENHFYVRTNLEAKNFRLMKTPVNATGSENWQEVIPHRADVLMQGFEIFES